MEIKAADVMKLRHATNAGMMSTALSKSPSGS